MAGPAGFIVALFLMGSVLTPLSPMIPDRPATSPPAPDACGCATQILGVGVTPAQSIGPMVNHTFAGHTSRGWGFSNTTITRPGPNMTVFLGDVVTLTLVANDTQPHSWFIDYDDDRQIDVDSEPHSPDFNTGAGPETIVWSFTANRPGTWTYRCGIHPTTMFGTIEVRPEGRPLNVSLNGEIQGWGLPDQPIANPGPELVVGVGALVTLTLAASDTSHTWFIDYDNDREADGNEPESPDFGGPDDPAVLEWNFTANRPGEYTYRCGYHPTTMTGTIVILGEAPPPAGGLGIVPAVLLVALAGVLVFAVVYEIRARQAAKRRK